MHLIPFTLKYIGKVKTEETMKSFDYACANYLNQTFPETRLLLESYKIYEKKFY